MSLRFRRVRGGGALALLALAATALLALPSLAAAMHGESGETPENGHANAGAVSSYDPESGALTIDLRAGGSVTALVTGETRIRCVGRKRGHKHGGPRGGKGKRESGENGAAAQGRRGEGKRQRRGRGHRCGTGALTEGAKVRKARIGGEGGEADFFERILVAKPKHDRDKGGPTDGGEEGPSEA